ncbi:lactate/malate dehydrogenase family protein [Aspergillus lucknowensis]|uniref:L-lactate dehydrogenase n=1 Tax=Aspergillus lucknowensis TaxID=176173 RepID=A0ABR4M1T3_9EURO
MNKPTYRIAIIGVGQVGAAAAYAIILSSIAAELYLVDVKAERRDGQVRDLADVAYTCGSSTHVRAATHQEARECDIVVITAGSKYSYGQTSSEHLYHNTGILRSIVNEMKPFRPETILLVVANPVDLLTSLAKELSGLPASQVIGSGTFLDSERLRGLVAENARIAANSLDLYVLGVHGESQVAAWSCAAIGGVPMQKALAPNSVDEERLAKECKHRSQNIVRAKGAMPFGIGAIVSSICASIVRDKRNVRPISHFQERFGCCLSFPVVLGREGVMRSIPMPLSKEEEERIVESARVLRETFKRVQEQY